MQKLHHRSVTCMLFLNLVAAVCVRAAAEPAAADMRSMIERYTIDRESLMHRYNIPFSEARDERIKKFYEEWQAKLAAVDFYSLDEANQIDYLLMQNHLQHAERLLSLRQKQFTEMGALLPFSKAILDLAETRWRMQLPQPQQNAEQLTALVKKIGETREAAEAELASSAKPTAQGGSGPALIHVQRTTARRAAQTVGRLREVLKDWFEYYNGYDPLFTWWAAQPYKEADQALEAYAKFLDEKLVGIKPDDKSTIIGDPVGREALLEELRDAMIPYTPEELIALGKREMAWCVEQMKLASREMGYGDDWHKALEVVKEMHVAPGEQPALIRKLALDATEYVEKNELVTVPELAKETWGMRMMTPERQVVNPFLPAAKTSACRFRRTR